MADVTDARGRERMALVGAVMIAAGLYNNATTVEQVETVKARPCFGGLRAERVSNPFEYDAATDQMACAEGRGSIGKMRVNKGDLHYFSMAHRTACPQRTICLTPVLIGVSSLALGRVPVDTRRMTGVILAGGKATRMGGGDKGLLRIGGRTSLERIIDVLRPRCAQLVVVPRPGVRYDYAGLETVADVYPNRGPLGGLHAGLLAARHSHAFVAACDMPGLAPDVVDFLIERMTDQDAIIPLWEGDIEPLHAVYARRILPRLEEALRRGSEGVREVLPHLRVEYVSEAELAALHGASRSFANVNTPAELRSAVELLGA